MEKIAKKLGTSKSVVSIALSNKYGVSEQTRSKILLAAHEMGYDFSKIKSFKRNQRKKQKITLVIANKMVLSETFWADIILGIESAASCNDVYLQVIIFNLNMRFNEILSEIHNLETGGLILIKDYDDNLVSKLMETSLPMVVVDPKHFTNVSCAQISASNYDSAYSCGKYLIEKGHRSFGYHRHRLQHYRHHFRGICLEQKEVSAEKLLYEPYYIHHVFRGRLYTVVQTAYQHGF